MEKDLSYRVRCQLTATVNSSGSGPCRHSRHGGGGGANRRLKLEVRRHHPRPVCDLRLVSRCAYHPRPGGVTQGVQTPPALSPSARDASQAEPGPQSQIQVLSCIAEPCLVPSETHRKTSLRVQERRRQQTRCCHLSAKCPNMPVVVQVNRDNHRLLMVSETTSVALVLGHHLGLLPTPTTGTDSVVGRLPHSTARVHTGCAYR